MKMPLCLIALIAIIPVSAEAGGCRAWYNEKAQQIGIYYSVDVSKPTPFVLACGHWELDGSPAPVPNAAHLKSGHYCRKTDDKGNIFFAYHWRGMLDCSKVGDRLQFKLEY